MSRPVLCLFFLSMVLGFGLLTSATVHAGGSDVIADNRYCHINLNYVDGKPWPGGVEIEWVSSKSCRGKASRIEVRTPQKSYYIHLDTKAGCPKKDYKFRIKPHGKQGKIMRMGNRAGDTIVGEVECTLNAEKNSYTCR